jgi:hypothetical protein
MRLALILLGMLLAQTVWAVEWTSITTSENLIAYIDFGSIKKTAKGRRAWVLYDFKSAQKFGKGMALSAVLLNDYDCPGGRFKPIQGAAYSGHMREGNDVLSGPREGDWEVPFPDSITAHLLEAACSAQPPK